MPALVCERSSERPLSHPLCSDNATPEVTAEEDRDERRTQPVSDPVAGLERRTVVDLGFPRAHLNALKALLDERQGPDEPA